MQIVMRTREEGSHCTGKIIEKNLEILPKQGKHRILYVQVNCINVRINDIAIFAAIFWNVEYQIAIKVDTLTEPFDSNVI